MTVDTSKSTLIKVAICFFLSGMAALLYQTAWMRQLSVVFGTSELAVATVLTAYMAGLALGAAVAAKYVDKITRPLLTYGLLEGGIAISAILVPYLLTLGGTAAAYFLGGQAQPPEASGFGQLLFYFVTTLIVLVVPTALMGATLPLLSKYVVKTDEHVGSRIGTLYAINTFGAVAGTLLAAFILLPNISLTQTILVGAAMNLLVLAVVVNVVKKTPEEESSDGHKGSVELEVQNPKPQPLYKAPYAWVLPVMTASGVATFIYEVLWTRLISHILGGSVPAFAIMLAAFLVGIAAGSAVATRYAKTQEGAQKAFIVTQIGIAALSALTYFMIDSTLPEKGGLLSNSLRAFWLILPSTLFIGATFPLAVRMFSNDETDAPSASAKVYAWNTVGAIFGATFAGYFLIPAIKYAGAIQFAVYLNLSLACIAVLFSLDSIKKTSLRLVPFLVLLLSVLVYDPGSPQNVIRFSPLGGGIASKIPISYYDVGRSSTVLLLNEGSYYRIRNNGLPEANIRTKGFPPKRPMETLMLSTLPVIARPDSKTMLIAGFGGGVIAEKIPPSIDEVDILELEPKVIEANKSISDLRALDPLEDPRVNIIYNDARSALQLTDKRYDIVVSQPSHPWTAGASHLYTRQYMQLVEDHLTDDGVFLQWMNIQFTDEFLLRSLTATLADTFKHVRVYQFVGGSLYFLASNSELEVEQNILNTGRPFIDHSDYYQEIGFGAVESILSGLVMDTSAVKEFSNYGKIITDDFNTLGTRSALAIDNGKGLGYPRLIDIMTKYSPIYSGESWVYEKYASIINFAYLADRVRFLGAAPLEVKLNQVLSNIVPDHFKAIRSEALVLNSQTSEAKKQLLAALKKFPDDEQLKYYLLKSYIKDGKLGNLPENISIYHDSMKSSAAAVINNFQYLDLDKENYSELQALDSELGQARQSDAWYIAALKMKAFWRTKLAERENNAELARQALNIIDKIFISGADSWTNELRVHAAYTAGDVIAVRHSFKEVVYILEAQLTRYQNPINMIRQDRKVEVLTRIERFIKLFSNDSLILEKERELALGKLKKLKSAYILLESSEGEDLFARAK